MPGNDMAIFLNRLLTLWPAFAEVSMNMMFICVDLAVASSSVTCLTAWGCSAGEDDRYTESDVPFVR